MRYITRMFSFRKNVRARARRGWSLLLVGVAGCCPLFAAQVADLGRDGIGIVVDAEPDTVDPGRDFIVTVTVKSPAGQKVTLPDLRDRFTGFQVADDLTEDPLADADGGTTLVSRWRLVPEPMAKKYRPASFVVSVAQERDPPAPGAEHQAPSTFYTSPVLFAPPPARATLSIASCISRLHSGAFVRTVISISSPPRLTAAATAARRRSPSPDRRRYPTRRSRS